MLMSSETRLPIGVRLKVQRSFNSSHRIISYQIPVGFPLADAHEHMPGKPVMLASGRLEGRLCAEVVVLVRHGVSAFEGPGAQAGHRVGGAAPQEAPVLHIDDRAVIDFEQIAGIEHGGVVVAEMGIVAAGVWHGLAAETWSIERPFVDQHGAAETAVVDLRDAEHAAEHEAAFEREFEVGVGEG